MAASPITEPIQATTTVASEETSPTIMVIINNNMHSCIIMLNTCIHSYCFRDLY